MTKTKYQSIATPGERPYEWTHNEIFVYVSGLLRKAENDLPEGDTLRVEARVVFDTLFKKCFENQTPLLYTSDKQDLISCEVHDVSGKTIILMDFFSSFAWLVSRLDDKIHGFREGASFYKRTVLRFARLCYRVAIDVFSPNYASVLGTRDPPAKAFIYFRLYSCPDDYPSGQGAAFLSTGVPNLAEATRINSKQMAVRVYVAARIRKVMLQRIKGLEHQPQKDIFPLGYCAESLSFAACLPSGGEAYGTCVTIRDVGRFANEEACEDAATPYASCCDTCCLVAEHARQTYHTKFVDLAHSWKVRAGLTQHNEATPQVNPAGATVTLVDGAQASNNASELVTTPPAAQSESLTVVTAAATLPTNSSGCDTLNTRRAPEAQNATVANSRHASSIEQLKRPASASRTSHVDDDAAYGRAFVSASGSNTSKPHITHSYTASADRLVSPSVRAEATREPLAGPSITRRLRRSLSPEGERALRVPPSPRSPFPAKHMVQPRNRTPPPPQFVHPLTTKPYNSGSNNQGGQPRAHAKPRNQYYYTPRR